MSTSNLSCIEWTATTRDTHRVLRPSDLPKEFRARNPNGLPWIITIVSEVSRPRFCLFTSATCQIPVRVAPKCGSENLFDMPARSTFKIGAARLRYVLFQQSHQARINTRFHFLRKSVRVFIWQQIYNIFLFEKKNYSIRNLENGLDNSFFFFFSFWALDTLRDFSAGFARLHPRRNELANILSEWLRNPGKGTSGS